MGRRQRERGEPTRALRLLTWLVGSADEVATALANYRKLGLTHFVLSDTPYQREIDRIGDHLLARLREPSA
ncbi:hypothetical protein [Streptomyces sp. NPDC002573]|uniref:hypothetical protein n=1 Tax=Streptomyces sp. NPDC002573 TaxID=3364651 RepID=UPI003675EF85